MFRRTTLPALALTVFLLSPCFPLTAADHLDAPSLSGNGQSDINDLYAFQSPSDPNNTVLIMTVNPFAGVLSNTSFGSDVSYEFQIDNNGDAIADITYASTFTASIAGIQTLSVERNTVPYATGSTKTDIATTSGGTVHAGLFEDPFFFDLVGFQNTLDPNSSDTFTGDDTFAGADVSAIVLELPSSELGSSTVGVWARTVVGGNQIDRMGRPAINTVLIPSSRKDEFNEGSPADDPTNFAADVQASIESLNGGDPNHAASVTSILLPDVLTIDTSDSSGFLNGRQLADDVIDAELGLLTQGALTTDMVDTNDVPFLNSFPYLAPANIPEPSTAALLMMALACCSRRRRPCT